MFYSATSNSFYDIAIHGDAMPVDAIAVTAERHAELMRLQSEGKIIQASSEGEPEAVERPEPTAEERQRVLTAAVQEHLDAAARELGYDDIRSAITYADEPAVAKFQDEGRALRAWRSKVWEACWDLQARVSSGEEEEPSATTLIARLPKFSIS